MHLCTWDTGSNSHHRLALVYSRLAWLLQWSSKPNQRALISPARFDMLCNGPPFQKQYMMSCTRLSFPDEVEFNSVVYAIVAWQFPKYLSECSIPVIMLFYFAKMLFLHLLDCECCIRCPSPFVNPNCISSTTTCCLIRFARTCSTTSIVSATWITFTVV